MKMDFKRIVILSAVVAAVAACRSFVQAPGSRLRFFDDHCTFRIHCCMPDKTTDTIDKGRICAVVRS